MSFTLLNTANAGVRASSELLQTTSKNITNVNTEGYVRERTEHATMIDNQVGRGQTVRLVNDFAQQQVVRDASNLSFYKQFVSDASRVDGLFAEDSNSLSASINSVFNSLQDAINQPSSGVTRSLFMNDSQGFVDQLNRLSSIVFDQQTVVNDQLEIYTKEANELITKISSLNDDIASKPAGADGSALNASLNERDQAIRDLAGYIDIETLDGPNGEKLVFMGTGEAVVMERGAFNLFDLKGDPDPNYKNLTLDVNGGSAIPIEVDTSLLKGKIGGLIAYRDQMLVPSQNQLGQIALALGDAFNTQNALGMDADGELGGDIFNLPSAGAYNFAANAGAGSITGSVEPGHGFELPATNFLITYSAANQVTVEALDGNGDVIAGSAITSPVVAGVANSATAGGFLYGLELNLSGAAAVNDQFELKLNSNASINMSLATDRPNDLALASPIKLENSINNTGSGAISTGVVTNTGAGSNFSGTPPTLTNGPISIVKTANPDEFTITDGANTATVTLAPNYDNVLAQAALVTPAFGTYGFDFDIKGTPDQGDQFDVNFNTEGFDDNRNGLLLGGLQQNELVRKNVTASAASDNLMTFNEAYAGMVSDVGIKTSQAKTNETAFTALAEQSEAWYESLSGVNLDEEAANLLRYQQSYAAAAQVLTTASTIFDTLINAAR